MRRLTDEEREIRSGRGISLKRWWPIVAVVIAALIASLDTSLQSCIGEYEYRRKSIRTIIQLALTYPCSPILLRGSWGEWLLFAAMWVPIPFGVLNWFWWKRHKAYWDRKRQRERELRAEKRSRKIVG
jgi:hypothetical protein